MASRSSLVRESTNRAELDGTRLVLGRALYLALAAFMLAIYVPQIPAFVESIRQSAVSQIAVRDGLPWEAIWPVLVFLRLFDTATHLGVAAFLVWRRPRDPFVLFTSFALLAIGVVHSSIGRPGEFVTPVDPLVIYVLLADGGILLLPFVFPDGRLFPRWGVWWWGLLMLATHILPFGLVPTPLATSIRSNGIALILVGAVLAQTQRYRHHSTTAVQRAQAKWFLFGVLIFTIVFGVRLAFASLRPDLFAPNAANELNLAFVIFVTNAAQPIAASVVPVAILIAALRWHLFSVDLVINRTLVYATLTATLVALSAFASAALHPLVAGLVGGATVASVATTLLVIGAFLPLRSLLQAAADRYVPERALLALLFMDVVSSTERVLAIGDKPWRELLELYRSTVRRELVRSGGREVDNAGDGFFATFQAPAQAVRCAAAVRGAVGALGLKIRTGVHVGECELRGSKVSGINVYTAARVMSAAGPDEILVSGTTRELVAGSEIRFEDRGTHQLKGLPEGSRLYAVVGV